MRQLDIVGELLSVTLGVDAVKYRRSIMITMRVAFQDFRITNRYYGSWALVENFLGTPLTAMTDGRPELYDGHLFLRGRAERRDNDLAEVTYATTVEGLYILSLYRALLKRISMGIKVRVADGSYYKNA
jgi:hypothetical protein